MIGIWIAAIREIARPTSPVSSRSRRWRLGRLVITLGCLGVLGLQVYQLLRAQACYSNQACNVDYHQFYDAALAIRHGADPYLPALAAQGTTQSTYVYPPLFALLLTPFTALSLPRALALWDGLNVAFLAAAIYALLRAAGARPALVLVALFTVVASLLGPVRSTLHWGQADLFILCCLCTALLARSKNRPELAGLLLGVACVTKPTYLALVVFLLWKREFKFSAVTVLAFLTYFFVPFLWLGGQALHDEVSTLQYLSGQYATTLVNHAPMGVLQRLFTVNPYVRPLVVAPWLVTVLWLVSVAVVGLLTMAMTSPKRLQPDARSLLEVGLAVLALFLVSPMTEEGHLTVLVVPLLALYAWLSKGDWRALRPRRVALGTVGVVLVLGAPLHSIEAALWARMQSAAWPMADAYMLLAAVYLYVLGALFGLQLYALSVASGRSILCMVRHMLDNAPALVRQ